MRCLRPLLLIFFMLLASFSFSQPKADSFLKPSDSLNTKRRNATVITESVAGGLTLLGLYQLWYSDFEQSKFHTINDANEWLQMDKLGHAYSSYQVGKYGAQVLNWSGVSKKQQLLYGATLGFGFLTVVEIFDGFSEEWGFSWSDMGANALGTGLYIGQELLWEEQRFQLKYSFHKTRFAPQRPEILGDRFLEQVLKDYNGQTYWLSSNIHSFFPDTKCPKWLNVALGYSVDGLLTGTQTTDILAFKNQNRKRQFYLSLDIDLTKIETKSNALKTIFSLLNAVKIPFPTVEFIGKNDIKLHSVYF